MNVGEQNYFEKALLNSDPSLTPRAGSRTFQPPVANETAVRGRLGMDSGTLLLPSSAGELLPFPAGYWAFPAQPFAVRPNPAPVSRAESVSSWAAKPGLAGRWLWPCDLTMVALSPPLLPSAWRPAGDQGRRNDKPGGRTRHGSWDLPWRWGRCTLDVATAARGSPGAGVGFYVVGADRCHHVGNHRSGGRHPTG